MVTYMITLDKDFLKHSKKKYVNTMPLDLLIQYNNEWRASSERKTSSLHKPNSGLYRHMNKAHLKMVNRELRRT